MSFNKLKLSPMLLKTCEKIHFYNPTPIQALAIPSIMNGNSVIANAQTGSGKTAAFGLPLIHKLSKDPSSIFAVIIAPSRQLAMQIHQQMCIFGQCMNLRQALVIGGTSISKQEEELENYPHIVVGTPGRIRYMLEKNEKFRENICRTQMVVLDEADRLFEETLLVDMKEIIASIQEIKQIILATATLDDNFQAKKLQTILGVSINFIKHSTYEGIKTVSENRLTHTYVFTPEQLKPGYLLQILSSNPKHKIIIFNKSCKGCTLMSETLKRVGYSSICLHSFMKFNQRVANLSKFRTNEANILVTTDLTSRGLDISHVNIVINYNLPRKISDYIHRVGRTARNGYQGQAISFVTQNEQELFMEIEENIGVKMGEMGLQEDLELVAEYNKGRRQVKIELMSSGVLNEIDKKSMAKKEKKMRKFGQQ